MESKHWLDYLTGIGSIATPIVVLVLTAVGWRFRRQLDRRTELEDKLRNDRIEIYNQILEPFVVLLMSDAAWRLDRSHHGKEKQDVAMAIMLSLEYRKKAFNLTLVGSDSVVTAYNDLMQYFYSHSDGDGESALDGRSIMSLLGQFLLEIRRSMGNEATKLSNVQMLEWFVTDARSWRQ